MSFSNLEENVGKENIKMELDVDLSVKKLVYGAYFLEQAVNYGKFIYAIFY
jgi:hypothetical protein